MVHQVLNTGILSSRHISVLWLECVIQVWKVYYLNANICQHVNSCFLKKKWDLCGPRNTLSVVNPSSNIADLNYKSSSSGSNSPDYFSSFCLLVIFPPCELVSRYLYVNKFYCFKSHNFFWLEILALFLTEWSQRWPVTHCRWCDIIESSNKGLWITW